MCDCTPTPVYGAQRYSDWVCREWGTAMAAAAAGAAVSPVRVDGQQGRAVQRS